MRRNTIANNELSGVSVFNQGGNVVRVAIDENTFDRNGSGSVKCDGAEGFARISRNVIVYDSLTVLTVNGCNSETFQNNYGFNSGFSGTPPFAGSGF